ncbi:tetratricopeptide repeat protein [Paenarthrobacter sp. YJN-D]|uniref:tetratricopeptide repeat protein n=1 Tax=Paenarthrobacter sp. YJN-D TaxID=2735317 RepID=UPI001878BA07|nr:tetratricopeptide repeat protein [Paenarthrobacter sp. YJN-D]QOT23066.1 tetratricopeptide repeat protein [Paenarthrobacter sp. YJN-D]
MVDVAPLVVSVVALLVSIYSVWNKQRESQRQTLLRLNTVVDELNKVSYDLQKDSDQYVATAQLVPTSLNSVANGRREILCAEAIQLAGLIKGGLTISQLRTVAAGFSNAGYLQKAESLLRQGTSRSISGPEKMFVERGLGLVLLRMGKHDEGRQAFKNALTVTLDKSDDRHWHRAETLIRWAGQERLCGDLSKSLTLLEEAESEARLVIDRNSIERLDRWIAVERGQLERIGKQR